MVFRLISHSGELQKGMTIRRGSRGDRYSGESSCEERTCRPASATGIDGDDLPGAGIFIGGVFPTLAGYTAHVSIRCSCKYPRRPTPAYRWRRLTRCGIRHDDACRMLIALLRQDRAGRRRDGLCFCKRRYASCRRLPVKQYRYGERQKLMLRCPCSCSRCMGI